MTGLVETTVVSPLGDLRLVASATALVGVYFTDHRPAPRVEARTVARHPVLDRAAREIGEYLDGARQRFNVPIAPRGTPFQLAVWRALSAIPFGATRSYAELARAVGRPRAARAVGAANAHNPLSIVVPCHRVVATGGLLAGYAGGIDAKRWLIAHEQHDTAPDRQTLE